MLLLSLIAMMGLSMPLEIQTSTLNSGMGHQLWETKLITGVKLKEAFIAFLFRIIVTGWHLVPKKRPLTSTKRSVTRIVLEENSL